MYDWMDYLNHSQGLHIRHKLNTGKEKKIDPYLVDGHDANTNTVYHFHGCYWHGHECWMTKNVKDQKWRETRQSKYDKTVKTTTLIQAQRYKVVEKWECHFRNEIRRNDKLKTFYDSRKPQTPQRSVTENKILEGVASGRLFGMVECDIRVPDKWPSYFQHPTMTTYQYFEEMSPLFCTTDVPFDLIGEHMQDHVQRSELSEKPRRLLVGGMRGREILIVTPLLKWYLEHGMVVTKIYQVVEFTPHRCFQEFVKEVSDGRPLGDAHPDKAIIGDTKNGEGNSAYVGTIMDQEKFQSVTYVQGEGRVILEANKPQLKKMTTLLDQDEYFEVEKAKEKLDINLPIQIGYFILQYAKLRMLQFYYDYPGRVRRQSRFRVL
jgi:G:T-mismatch repair DNA endonuclease (very short patch repair protein)